MTLAYSINKKTFPYLGILDFVFNEIKYRYQYCDSFGHVRVLNGICEYCYRDLRDSVDLEDEEVNLRLKELRIKGDLERAIQNIPEEKEIFFKMLKMIKLLGPVEGF